MIEEYDEAAPGPDETETATFALGCFWGPDAEFGAIEGVVRTRVGYAGGSKPDPTYHDLGDHTEAFQVEYDPDELSVRDLLRVAVEGHDPTRQTPKRQYQNVLFHDGPAQRAAVDDLLDETGLDPESVETRIEPLSAFYLAEDYHQKYHLRAEPSLLARFEEAGYDDEAIRESPAAAKLNGHATDHEIPAGHPLEPLVDWRPSA